MSELFVSHYFFGSILVLPNRVKQSLVNELDKRLDFDIDVILQSPKLRLQLSPAELDKKLLELYKNVADGPRGDVLRVIGGGNDVALQDFYVKRKSLQSRLGPANSGNTEENERTTSQWVNSVLKKNLANTEFGAARRGSEANRKDETDEMKMCLTSRHGRTFTQFSSCQSAFTKRPSCPGRSGVSSFSLLI